MYKALIIDDNPITVEALQSTVMWQELGIAIAGCAYDGVEGGEMVQKLQPDIIITDINMPEIDGLSMIEQRQEELKNARVIFITGFDKFQYASRAIKLSAFDFILKPIDNEELVSSLRRAVESLDRENDMAQQKERMELVIRRTQFLTTLTSGIKGHDDGTFWRFLERKPVSYFFIVAENKTGLSRPLLQRLDYMKFPSDTEVISTVVDGELILLCSLQNAKVSWRAVARSIADTMTKNLMDVTVAISGIHTAIEDFQVAYKESRQTLLWHNIYGRHADVEFYGSQTIDTSKHSRLMDLEQICTKLALKPELDSDRIWDAIWEKSSGRLNIIRLMLMFFFTKVMQEKIASYQWEETLDFTVYGITKLDTVEEAKNWLHFFMGELKKKRAPVNSALTRNVLEYVRSHAIEGLVLENVAAQFYVSPNYLSTLIRKETGITYRQHVINAKINVAKQLLDDTRMRVEDIAYAIEYENYISFYNVFKKTEGVSPTEYRFRNRRNEVVSC